MSEKLQQKPQQEQQEQQEQWEIKKAEKVTQRPQEAIKAEKESRMPVRSLGTLDEIQKQIEQAETISTKRIAQRTITLVSETKKLTPHLLSAELSPFLNAIEAIQRVIDSIQGRPPKDVLIKSISQNSPITVTLEGAVKAIQVLIDIVVPSRRKHQEKLARLELQNKKAEIDSKKAEILERQAKAAKDQSEAERIKAEADRQRAETERMMLEIDKLRYEVSSDKIQLALEMLAKVAPALPDIDKGAYLAKLLPPLSVVISSGLEVGDS